MNRKDRGKKKKKKERLRIGNTSDFIFVIVEPILAQLVAYRFKFHAIFPRVFETRFVQRYIRDMKKKREREKKEEILIYRVKVI